MTDNLTIFGTTYTGVTGIIATDTNDADKTYIRPQGTKSITSNGTGIDVTEYASVDVAVPSSTPSLQTKTKTYTPTNSQQTETVTADSGYDGLAEVDITVNAMQSGTEGTPTATKGTVSNNSVTVTPSVTNSAGYISGGTHSGAGVSVAASELVSGTYSVTSSGTKDVTNYASASVPSLTLPSAASPSSSGTSKATISRSTSDQYINIPTGFNNTAQYYKVSAVSNGTEGTPTASKGTVNNHSVSVTPSVTNSAGYISGGTHTGTAVTVSASELVSGSETKTANGTYDVTNLASLVVNLSYATIYTGSSAPSSSLGVNGDIYLQV